MLAKCWVQKKRVDWEPEDGEFKGAQKHSFTTPQQADFIDEALLIEDSFYRVSFLLPIFMSYLLAKRRRGQAKLRSSSGM